MSERADLLKALNNLTAALAAYAPGSHHVVAVLEVGDAAFRAFERDALPNANPSPSDRLECWTQSGRVVIRKRPMPAVEPCCSWDTDGDGECPKHPKSGPFAKALAEQQEREKVDAANRQRQERKSCPGCRRPGVMHTCAEQYGKQSTCVHGRWRNCPCCPSPPEETKRTEANPGPGQGITFDPPVSEKQADAAMDALRAARDHAPDCRVPHRPAESCTEANVPSRAALSPRQALGEALACVERARDLLRTVATTPLGDVDPEVRIAAFRAYDNTTFAWGNITTARACLVEPEPK